MAWLPVVTRELKVASRRGKTYWLRMAAATAAFLVIAYVSFWSMKDQPPYVIGKTLFTSLSILAFGYALLVGPFLTADCIAEEKRDGTLGLLFLTDLNSWDVVLGKWVAASLGGFFGLLAILPALGVPLLMGGVTPGEYGRTALAVVNALLFSLTAGMLVSTWSRDQAKATLASAMVILGFSGLIPGLFVILSTKLLSTPMAQLPVVSWISPAYTGYFAQDVVFKAGTRNFWGSLITVHCFCWAFMIATCVIVPTMWRDSHEEKPVATRWLYRFGYSRGWRKRFAKRIEVNPVWAMAARWRWPHLVFWTLAAIVAVNVYWLTYGYQRNPQAYQFHTYFATALIFLNRIWLTVMACMFMLESRRTGALELMLTTPLPAKTLLRGHWRALRHYFFWPVLAIGLLHVGYVAGTWMLNKPATFGTPMGMSLHALSAAGSFVSFVSDVVAICFLGTWLSVSMRKPTFALLATYTVVVLVPWAVAYYMPVFRWGAALGTYMYALGRPVGWLAKNGLIVLWSWYRLRSRFRDAAAQTHREPRRRDGRPSWWRRFGSRGRVAPVAALVAPEG